MDIYKYSKKFKKIKDKLNAELNLFTDIPEVGDTTWSNKKPIITHTIVFYAENYMSVYNPDTRIVTHYEGKENISWFFKHNKIVGREQINIFTILWYLRKTNTKKNIRYNINSEGFFICYNKKTREIISQIDVNLSQPNFFDNIELLLWFYNYLFKNKKNGS